MELIFVSNYLNHHSAPLCQQFCKLVDRFAFVATMNTDGIGYTATLEADYVLDYTDPSKQKEIEERICNADCVIFGDCPNSLIRMRMQNNKISFLYSERFFKKGAWRRFIPFVRKRIIERVGQYKDQKMYVLCASSYLPSDLRYFSFPGNKCYKWGYFPQLEEYTDADIIAEKSSHKCTRIIWAARMVPLKHPEVLIRLAEQLRDGGLAFELCIVGSGPVEEQIRKAIQEKQLGDYVKMLGALTPQETRKQMFRSDIFLFTSDYHEGWGAVVNEAMNAGCAVVCSDAVGSARFLIKEGDNGYCYSYSKPAELIEYVRRLLKDDTLRLQKGVQAHRAIAEKWNAAIAAHRFVTLFQSIEQGNKTLYEDGPCSLAEKDK